MKMPRVLFVDDEIELAMNFAETLRLMGYEASIANSGALGLHMIERQSYDVVVLDLRMPGISGLDVLKRIRTESKGSPEVIILTGYATTDSSLDSLSHGAFDYLPKPIKIKELVDRITEAYERKILKDQVLIERENWLRARPGSFYHNPDLH